MARASRRAVVEAIDRNPVAAATDPSRRVATSRRKIPGPRRVRIRSRAITETTGMAATETVLEVDDLRLPESQVSPVTGDAFDAVGEGLRRLLRTDREAIHQTVERLLLVTAFEHCDRNQVRTAKRLGLSRNIVRAQLKRHGLLESSLA